jgi:nitroimidazol reductase NimA-like FMN-containing flavoprotein (pyridoxamine 5'-phosphate oxidase superfamily)
MRHETLTDAEIAEFLTSQRVVRVAFYADGELYLVPLGYVWYDSCLCCGTSEGHKTAIAARSPRVAFQVDNSCVSGLLHWTSVTGEGLFEPDDSLALKAALFLRFADVPREEISGPLRFFRIRPLHMSGRRNFTSPAGSSVPG